MTLDTLQEIRIVTLSGEGSTAKLIEEKTGVPLEMVYRILKQFRGRGTVGSRKSLRRPRKLMGIYTRALVRETKKNRHATLAVLTNSLPAQVHPDTVRTTLHKEGIHSRAAKKKPFLNNRHTKGAKPLLESTRTGLLPIGERLFGRTNPAWRSGGIQGKTVSGLKPAMLTV